MSGSEINRLEVDMAMLQSMATSFRARMDFSLNADDMADLLDRIRAALPEVQAIIAGVLGQAASMSGPDRIFTSKCGNALVTDHPRWDDDKEYIRRDRAVIAALPEVQALTAAAEARALAGVTTLHTVIADIRAATVGSKPMLSELAAALVAWRDEAVKAEREACAQEAEGHLNDWSADLAHTFACYVVAQHSGMMNGRKISRDLAIKFAAEFRQRAEAVAEAAEHTAAANGQRLDAYLRAIILEKIGGL